MTATLSVRALAPLLAAITLAEEISRDVTARQALLAPPRLRGTLRQQSWQEAAHATVFRTALHCTPKRSSCPPRLQAALGLYAARLHADLDRGALAASMVGLHCVLEGVAAVALEPPPRALAQLADQVVPLRAFILQQEQGHQRLGEVWVPRLVPEPAALVGSARDYCELAEGLLTAGLATLECLDQDSGHYRERVRSHLRATTERLADTGRVEADLDNAQER